MSYPQPLLAGNLDTLNQGLALLSSLSDELYTGSWRGLATVGAQYRHVLEHYQALFDGLEQGEINYDQRARDRDLETSRQVAEARTRDLLVGLPDLEDFDRPLRVHLNTGMDTIDWHPSSLGRELQFLSSHTVHHFALIRLLLLGLGHETGATFGVAPSTLAFERTAR